VTKQVDKFVVKKYESYGLIAGLGLGSLAGTMVSGPNFHDWSAIVSLAVILGGGAAGAAIGYLAVSIAYGSTIAGFGIGSGISDLGHGSGGHSGSGDGGGDSGGAGDGGGDGAG